MKKKNKLLLISIVLLILIGLGIYFYLTNRLGEITDQKQIDKLTQEMNLDVILNTVPYSEQVEYSDNNLAQYIFFSQINGKEKSNTGYYDLSKGFVRNNGDYDSSIGYIAQNTVLEQMAKELFNVKANASIWQGVHDTGSIVWYDQDKKIYYVKEVEKILPVIQYDYLTITKIENQQYKVEVGYKSFDAAVDLNADTSEYLLGRTKANLVFQYNQNNEFFKYTLLSIEKEEVK
ncbi:MAG: hypothetical protein ACLUD1_02385 [Clostridia bacterium]